MSKRQTFRDVARTLARTLSRRRTYQPPKTKTKVEKGVKGGLDFAAMDQKMIERWRREAAPKRLRKKRRRRMQKLSRMQNRRNQRRHPKRLKVRSR